MGKLVLAAAQSVPLKGDIEGNVSSHVRLIRKAMEHSVGFILFPELSLTGYERELAASHALKPDDPRLDVFQNLSNELSIHILVGAPFRDEHLHIAAFLYSPGDEPKVYTKHHLHVGEEKYFHPGNKALSFNLSGEEISVAICADIAHSIHAQNAASIGSTVYTAGVLITPGGYDEDASLLKSGAEQYGMAVIMANFGGPSGGYESAGRSAVWDRNGKLVAIAPENGEALVLFDDTGRVIPC